MAIKNIEIPGHLHSPKTKEQIRVSSLYHCMHAKMNGGKMFIRTNWLIQNLGCSEGKKLRART